MAGNSCGEADSVVQRQGEVYAVEVKTEESLHVFNERYEGVRPRRFSLSGFRDEGWMCNVPLWVVGSVCWRA